MPIVNQNISINNLPDLLTVREVAQVLRVSPLLSKDGAREENCQQLELIPEETGDIKRSSTLATWNPTKNLNLKY